MKITLLLTASLLAGLTSVALCAEDSSTHLKFSDPSKPGTLRVNLEGGELKIVGSSEATGITVASDAKANSGQKRADGLRVLSTSTTFSLTEKDNVAVLEAGFGRRHGNTSSYKITVPQNTSVIVSNLYGETNCVDLSGDLDVRSSNGAVTLKDIQAGASVETMNGTIHVSVKQLLPGHALSFSSMNGEIVVHLPEEAKANLRLRTQNGSILTDYDDKDLVATSTNDGTVSSDESQLLRDTVRQAAEVAREAARQAREAVREGLSEAGGHSAPLPPLPPLPPMTGGQIVSGVLHGGGTDVQATTMNGDVTVRKG